MTNLTHWREVPLGQVIAELRRLNSGAQPGTFQDCEAIAARLNWRFRFLPREAQQDACADKRKHVIYLPPVSDPVALFRVAVHELSEVITHQDGGEPEYHYQGGEEEHHHVARLVERLFRIPVRTRAYNVLGELPPPPGDADAPPPALDAHHDPRAVVIRSHYDAAVAFNTLSSQENRLLQQLTRIRQAKAIVDQKRREL